MFFFVFWTRKVLSWTYLNFRIKSLISGNIRETFSEENTRKFRFPKCEKSSFWENIRNFFWVIFLLLFEFELKSALDSSILYYYLNWRFKCHSNLWQALRKLKKSGKEIDKGNLKCAKIVLRKIINNKKKVYFEETIA